MGPIRDIRFRTLYPADGAELAALFSQIDTTYFRPHPLTAEQAEVISRRVGRDVYAILERDAEAGEAFVAYGMLRGWDEGYAIPYLGVAVRSGQERRGLGRLMMAHLHEEAARRGVGQVRLRVHPENGAARALYLSLGYAERGIERDEVLMTLDLPVPRPA
jgi:[ribosomal protein S18]-alanine N-acetyltransferase